MQADITYGATEEEWNAFIALARTDLLPYIADPAVIMHPDSGVRAGDKVPGKIALYDPKRRGIGIRKWNLHQASMDNINEWRLDSRHGICLITRNIRAIDIDVENEDLAEELDEWIRDFLAPAGFRMPSRSRPNSARRTLFYRLCDAENKLVSYSIPVCFEHTPTEKAGLVEFLFDHRQTLVAGRHPSGVRYEWLNGLPTQADIPVIELALIRQLIRELQDAYAVKSFNRTWKESEIALVKSLSPDEVNPEDDPVIEFLYNAEQIIDVTSDGGYFVKCPWEWQHTPPTRPDSAKYYPYGLNNVAQAGFHCFHAGCGGQNHQEYLKAIGYTASQFPVLDEKDEKAVQIHKAAISRPSFTYRGRSSFIEPILPNIVKMLEWEAGVGIRLHYDVFRDSIIYRINGVMDKWGELDDDVYTQIRLHLAMKGMEASISKENVRDAVSFVAKKNVIDSAQEHLNSLRWDGVNRLDTFHINALRLEDTPYHKAACLYLWTALAGRVLEPGIKADMVPVLVGIQGLRKSSLVECLAFTPNEFITVTLHERDDNLARQLRGKLVAEWDELRGLNSRDSESIKGWISHRTDEWIPKFKEFGTNRPRRFIIIGTQNEKRFLNDPTGARRFLPLMIVHVIDTDYVIENRNQLWAEAAVRFKESGIAWRDAERLAVKAQRQAQHQDVWTTPIIDWVLSSGVDGLTTAQILVNGVGLSLTSINRSYEERVRRVMMFSGWEESEDGRWFCTLV